MRIRSSTKWLFALGFVAYAGSPASAQPVPPSSTPGSSGAPGAPGTVGPTTAEGTGSAAFGNTPKRQLAPQEQLAEGKKHVERMEQAAGGVRTMLSTARKSRDVVKALCLNDKLSQADVTVRSGRSRVEQLGAAVARRDTEGANHEFTILTVLRQRSEQVVAEANQCVGTEAAFVGETVTTTTEAKSIPPEDAEYPAQSDDSLVQTPPCTSCTL